MPPGPPPERRLRNGRKIEHALSLKPDSKAVSQQPYKLSPTELDEVLRTLTYTAGMDETIAVTLGFSPVFLPRKKSGKIRMCTDYRALNHATVRVSFRMPLIDELVINIQGYQVVSKLDPSEDFHQIRTAPADVQKTAFSTQFCAFEYLVMPFDLSNARAQFTWLMNSVLDGLDFVVVVKDDIFVLSKILQDHHKALIAVLYRLREDQLQAPAKKCKFYRSLVEY
jgi:hypothetical protein